LVSTVGCSSSNVKLDDPATFAREASKTELALFINQLDLSGQRNSRDYDILFAEAQRRGALAASDVVRIRENFNYIGTPVFSVFATDGLPTHLSELQVRDGGEMIALYYYQSLLVLERRQVVFVQNGRVVGFATRVRNGNSFRWEKKGRWTNFWQPGGSSSDLLSRPGEVETCRNTQQIECITYLLNKFG